MTPREDSPPVRFRHPTVDDGAAIWQLVVDAGTLDQNSSYLYLLLCRDFADCCAVAEAEGELLGFTSGFRSAKQPDVWFLWQVGVAASARGQRLAGRMAHFILNTLAPENVRYLETTVAPSNEASRALFVSIARRLDTGLAESELFIESQFPPGEGVHEAEPLLRIGPFDAARVAQVYKDFR